MFRNVAGGDSQGRGRRGGNQRERAGGAEAASAWDQRKDRGCHGKPENCGCSIPGHPANASEYMHQKEQHTHYIGAWIKRLYLSLQGGASTSSAFPCENGGPLSSSSSSAPVSQVVQYLCIPHSFLFWYKYLSKGTWAVFQIPVKSPDSPPSKVVSDISHLVRKKVGLASCIFFLMAIFLFNHAF